MTIRNEVEEMIGSVLVRLDDGSLDPNAFCRRMFRCWLDGSYDGAETYQANVSELKGIVSGWTREQIVRQLRAWVIEQFTGYVAHEAGSAYGTAQRYIVSATSAEDLAELTGELIDDALELISDDVSDELRSDIIDAYNERYGADPVVVGVSDELRSKIIDAYQRRIKAVQA